MNRRDVAAGLLGIDRAFRLFHDHRLDPAYRGIYYMRLPDGRRVPIARYEEELRRYREHADGPQDRPPPRDGS